LLKDQLLVEAGGNANGRGCNLRNRSLVRRHVSDGEVAVFRANLALRDATNARLIYGH
jgi:hypothetical protein